MKLPVIFALVLALFGCADEPSDYVATPSSSQTGASQALARCRARSYSTSVNPAANPLFAAAYQQQFIADCMRAAGYEVR